jgi:hypothetical protein
MSIQTPERPSALNEISDRLQAVAPAAGQTIARLGQRSIDLLGRVSAHPVRVAGFAFGLVLPLLAAGLILTAKGGGLSDAGKDTRPPAFVVFVD